MKTYQNYKEAFPNKTDAQIIESLSKELSDKVETIHQLLAEIETHTNENAILVNKENLEKAIDLLVSYKLINGDIFSLIKEKETIMQQLTPGNNI